MKNPWLQRRSIDVLDRFCEYIQNIAFEPIGDICSYYTALSRVCPGAHVIVEKYNGQLKLQVDKAWVTLSYEKQPDDMYRRIETL